MRREELQVNEGKKQTAAKKVVDLRHERFGSGCKALKLVYDMLGVSLGKADRRVFESLSRGLCVETVLTEKSIRRYV